jgi:hypothetical protein
VRFQKDVGRALTHGKGTTDVPACLPLLAYKGAQATEPKIRECNDRTSLSDLNQHLPKPHGPKALAPRVGGGIVSLLARWLSEVGGNAMTE